MRGAGEAYGVVFALRAYKLVACHFIAVHGSVIICDALFDTALNSNMCEIYSKLV